MQQVYSSWISEETVISPTAKLVIEPQLGGIYRLIMANDAIMNGIFSEVEPNQRLKYSWQWEGSDEIAEVEVIFAQHPAGTNVHITHSEFQSSTSLDNHAAGWDSYIEGFKAYQRQHS